MGRENKKEHIAAVHRDAILAAAEVLFVEKGVSATTIEDIAKQSSYSRRTIYAYYPSKETILHQIILKGLLSLKESLVLALEEQTSFLEQYAAICRAMTEYHKNSPQAALSVNQVRADEMDLQVFPQPVRDIFATGTEINRLLARFIEQGKQQGLVRSDVVPMQSVYILWSSISALLTFVQSKERLLEQECQTTSERFLAYGFQQIINAILEERLPL